MTRAIAYRNRMWMFANDMLVLSAGRYQKESKYTKICYCSTCMISQAAIDQNHWDSSVPLQLALHLGIKIIHLVLQVLGLRPGAIDLFVLAVQLPAHDPGALVPSLSVASEGSTVKGCVSSQPPVVEITGHLQVGINLIVSSVVLIIRLKLVFRAVSKRGLVRRHARWAAEPAEFLLITLTALGIGVAGLLGVLSYLTLARQVSDFALNVCLLVLRLGKGVAADVEARVKHASLRVLQGLEVLLGCLGVGGGLVDVALGVVETLALLA
jgi:hypothetical protein